MVKIFKLIDSLIGFIIEIVGLLTYLLYRLMLIVSYVIIFRVWYLAVFDNERYLKIIYSNLTLVGFVIIFCIFTDISDRLRRNYTERLQKSETSDIKTT